MKISGIVLVAILAFSVGVAASAQDADADDADKVNAHADAHARSFLFISVFPHFENDHAAPDTSLPHSTPPPPCPPRIASTGEAHG